MYRTPYNRSAYQVSGHHSQIASPGASDTLSLTDLMASFVVHNTTISDALSLTDLMASFVIHTASISESATFTDATVQYFDYYVSAAGNDSNAGTSISAPLLTLAQAKILRTAAGGSKSIALRRGDTWREAYDETATGLTGTTIGAYGSGSPPIINGAIVVASWTKTVGRTNVYETTQSQNGSGSNRSVVLVDGLPSLTRVATIALCDSTAGSYFNADASAAASMISYIHPVGDTNPNSDGHSYEVTIRLAGITLGASGHLTDVEVGPVMNNNGSIDVANSVNVSRAVARFGTKHNTLAAGGVFTDMIALYVDGPSASETGVIPYVAFAADATGRNFTFQRCHFYETTRLITTAFYSHSNTDPSKGFDVGTVDQCIVRSAGAGGAFQANANTMIYTNCCGVMTNAGGSLLSVGADLFTITRLYGTQLVAADLTVTGHNAATPTGAFTNCAVYFANSSKAVRVPVGGVYTFTRCSFALQPANFQNAIYFVATPTTTVTVNRCIIQANNAIDIPTGASYVGNNNVFVRPPTGIGPFATYHGTGFNLSTNMAGWRAATGQDANSIVLTTTPFSGTLTNGDFRVTTASLTGAGHDGDAGPNDHWDYNLRSAQSGPPIAWPVIPVSLSEARSFILSPTTWTY